MASATHGTEKPIAHQNQNQQGVLKCPRCDSSNTKFCYYNNYSLSQPRHFCKGCKRYWTRGGTLRNVPVGGGCRKNKRIKTTLTTNDTSANSTTVTFGHNSNPNLDRVPSSSSSTTTSYNNNPLYAGLLIQRNPTYSTYTRVSTMISDTNVSRHDHSRMSSFELGFSSSSDPAATNHTQNSISLYPSAIFSCGSTDPTMPAHLASSFEQQRPRFLGFSLNGDGYGSVMNDVDQMEAMKSRTDWNDSFHSGQIDNHQLKLAIDSTDKTSNFPWTTSSSDGGEWLDPTSNICSSLPSSM